MKFPPTLRDEIIIMSPPARGAWIEMPCGPFMLASGGLSPPHGGRGLKCAYLMAKYPDWDGRPPHGGRGLK